ncbi:formylmethanofuran--tetrahydromethanopterin N-formyltransferase [uncultured Rubinisphaera sp.]|uniref:formylmethanofuran--tetrahydromethanopterin N-formyltransferase n=1 Tax=uncultured Rubinisphaera sp. TaxID=1678686 RepID=UPI0030D96EA1
MKDRISWQGTLITDTFAEAFSVTGTRIIITAGSEKWAEIAAYEVTGYGTSVIACDAEAGIDTYLTPEQTPDGRPGVAVMLFAFNLESLAKAVLKRVGQCILTCPTTAVFDGVEESTDAEKRIDLGKQLRYFGDGFQASKVIGGRRYWRIPVMDGEFLCEEHVGSFRGVAGGNLLIGGESQLLALEAAERSVEAMMQCPQVIMPFPGGIVRSGSKVGSRYQALRASTNDAYCPTLKPRTQTDLLPETSALYEIVIDGRSAEHVGEAMKAGLAVLSDVQGVTEISAGNYGGKLGKHHFHLREILDKLN